MSVFDFLTNQFVFISYNFRGCSICYVVQNLRLGHPSYGKVANSITFDQIKVLNNFAIVGHDRLCLRLITTTHPIVPMSFQCSSSHHIFHPFIIKITLNITFQQQQQLRWPTCRRRWERRHSRSRRRIVRHRYQQRSHQ